MTHRTLRHFGMFGLLAFMTCACQGPAPKQDTASTTDAKSSEPPKSAARAPSSKTVGTARDVLPAQLQVTVYEVQAAADRVGALDARSLARQATTAESLLKVLSEAGPARILYRIDQPVNVFSESIRVGSREPIITASRTSQSGDKINSITYHEVGVTLRLSAQAPSKSAKRKGPDVTMNFELATLAPSSVEFAPGSRATLTRQLSLDHTEPLEFGQPRVMLAVSSSASDAQTPPVVYVVRYLFGSPSGK